MLLSWLLAIPYLAAIGLLLVFAWLMGRPANAFFASSSIANLPASGFFSAALRIALGLSLLSYCGAIAGVTGNFNLLTVMLLAGALLTLGSWYGSRFSLTTGLLRRDLKHIRESWTAASWPIRLLSAGLTLCCIILAANSLVGAMVPDMNHDPMWYHLTVPQQWVYDERYFIYPNVMPSSHALAVESLYAIIFLVRVDPVLCSLLHASCGITVFISLLSASRMVLASHPNAGWGVGAVAAIWVPAISVYGMLAPVQPKNDFVVMFWAFTGSMALWIPLLTGTSANLRHWILGGILLATAVSGKGFVIPIGGLVFLAAVFYQARTISAATTLKFAAASLVAMAVYYLPWGWRGHTGHGLPVFPLGQNLFTINPTYQPTINAFEKAHTLPGTIPKGFAAHLLATPSYLNSAMRSGELAIFLVIIIATLGIINGRSAWRVYATMLACQIFLIAAGRGFPLVFRLLAPVYCLATPLTAHLAATSASRFRSPMRMFLALLIAPAMWMSTANRQQLGAATPTLKWNFRPMLSQADVHNFASHAEHGGSYIAFNAIQEHIPPHDRVLLLGSNYPFYLHRDTLWNDEVVDKGGVQDCWLGFSTAEAQAFLQDEQIDWILHAQKELSTQVADELTSQGILAERALPPLLQTHGWRLYENINTQRSPGTNNR